MQELQDLIRQVVSDRDLTPEQVPALDLYIEPKLLTLFNDGLRDSKRHPEDKLLTKTIINNYSKEKLLSPIKGKKVQPSAYYADVVRLSAQADTCPGGRETAYRTGRCGL